MSPSAVEKSNGKNPNNNNNNNNNNSLLPLLQEAFPTVTSYNPLKTILQSNANSYIVELQTSTINNQEQQQEEQDNVPDQVFVKHVMASDYVSTKKDWPDLRRTLCYARTETRFYDSFLPLLLKETGLSSRLFPKVYRAMYNFQDWIPENEAANAISDPTINHNQLPNPDQRGAHIILQVISSDLYYQASPISPRECQRTLQAIAALHAAAWKNQSLLRRATNELSRASFHLRVRNPKEINSCVETWQAFLQHFESYFHDAQLSTDPNSRIGQLGHRTQRLAEYISNQLTPNVVDDHDEEHASSCSSYATLIHGDYKAMNAFLPRILKEEEESNIPPVVLVDFASCGVGLGVSDVAMHIHHAVTPEDLANPQHGEETLFRYYWETLNHLLNERMNKPGESGKNQDDTNNNDPYPWSVALRHYKLAVVDYFRFFMARMWKNATPQTMAARQDNANVNLINRYPKAAMAFIRRVDEYLSEIEKEYDAIK